MAGTVPFVLARLPQSRPLAAGWAAALRSWAVPVLAYIPSPPGSQLVLGPFHLRAYGLLIALGVFAAVWLGDRRWQARGAPCRRSRCGPCPAA